MDSTRPTLSPEDWSRHVAALRALARRLVQGEEEREDLVQGTLAAALERPPRALSWSWLAHVIRNRARDLGRRRGVRIEEATQEELVARGSSQAAAADVAARLELADEVSEALRALDEPYRTTLYLRYFEGLTPASIAACEGVPVRTVKSRLERGLALLRERLRRTYGADLAGLLPLLSLPPHVSTPTLPSSPASAGLLGGPLFMANKLAFVLLVCCLLGVWWYTRTDDHTARPSTPGAMPESERAFVTEPDEKPLEFARQTLDSASEAFAVVPGTETGARDGARRLRVTVTWPDGLPAAGVRVELRRSHATLRVPSTPLRAEVTDQAGEARFRELEAGGVSVRVERGSEQRVDLEPGVEQHVELRIADGIELSGRVLDASGRAVAGAEVWLLAEWGPYDWLGMAPLARSGSDGRFHARDVPVGRTLGATADGYGPSGLARLEEDGEVELVLTGEAAYLAGRVLDEAGRGVVGARVCAGGIGMPRMDFKGGGEPAWAPRMVVSDAEGRFEFQGLAPGQVPLSVSAHGFAGWTELRDLVVGHSPEVVVRLSLAAAVEGCVRDEKGEPVANAGVRAFAWAQPTSFLSMGQYEDSNVFGSPFTLTGVDGRYRIEDVWVGEAHLYASPPRGEPLRSEFHAEARLLTRSGATSRWDPVLEPGATVRGRLLYADGRPMSQHFVHLRIADADEAQARSAAMTDEEGRFAFHNLTAVPHHVEVQLNAPPPGAKPLVAESVFPDGPELELVADYSADRGQGRVTGELVDPTQRCGSGLYPGLERDRGLIHFADRFEEERFEFSGVPEGRYRVIGLLEQETVVAGPWFALGLDEAFDAGRLEIEPAVRLTLRLKREPALEGEDVRGYLATTDSPFGSMFAMGTENELTLERTPGVLELRLWCQGSAQIVKRFELEGERTLQLELLRGVWAPVDIDWPGELAATRLHISVTDETGEVVDQSEVRSDVVPRPYRYGPLVPLGRYVLRVTTDSGLSGEVELTVEDLGAPPPAQRLELKR